MKLFVSIKYFLQFLRLRHNSHTIKCTQYVCDSMASLHEFELVVGF